MSAILIVGIVLFVGFVLGQELKKLKFPKIVGYILAGVLFNPHICHFVPKNITTRTDILENIAIAFIAFAVGGYFVFGAAILLSLIEGLIDTYSVIVALIIAIIGTTWLLVSGKN